MKPYTLEWWQRQRDIAFSGRINTSYALRFTEPMTKERDLLMRKRKRYSELSQFIHGRIIKKYGEK